MPAMCIIISVWANLFIKFWANLENAKKVGRGRAPEPRGGGGESGDRLDGSVVQVLADPSGQTVTVGKF
jgi:hypothetical protein